MSKITDNRIQLNEWSEGVIRDRLVPSKSEFFDYGRSIQPQRDRFELLLIDFVLATILL